MRFGAHLPLIDLDGTPRTLAGLRAYARQAAALDFSVLCANDHLLFTRPWLDGPTALAAVLEASAEMTIATTVTLPVVRGPVQTAKLLGALDVLSGGRVIAGIGHGSSARDYAAAGVPFRERWTRFDEAVRVLRSLLVHDEEPFSGTFYSTEGIQLESCSLHPGGPPLWIASWGSPAGLRRVAQQADGWLASAYNTTPSAFRQTLSALSAQLQAAGKDATTFPHAIATMWFYVTDSRRAGEWMLTEVLAPLLNRSADELCLSGLPIGSAEACAERINAYADAGAQLICLWPLADELHQLQAFREKVAPLLSS